VPLLPNRAKVSHFAAPLPEGAGEGRSFARLLGSVEAMASDKVGPWTKEEDEKLRFLVHGQTNVNSIKWR
jgi:hypothetical protein